MNIDLAIKPTIHEQFNKKFYLPGNYLDPLGHARTLRSGERNGESSCEVSQIRNQGQLLQGDIEVVPKPTKKLQRLMHV